MEFLENIPRIYTAVAEWGACLVFVQIIRGWRLSLKKIAGIVLMLIWQCFFLELTKDVRGIGWPVCMFTAACAMFTLIYFCCEIKVRQAVYLLSFAFVLAETAASLVWQIITYLQRIGMPDELPAEILLLFVFYGGLYSFTYFYEKSILRKEFLSNISNKDMATVLIIALMTFVASNLSYLFDSPFSSNVSFDIFIIRTLVDIIGLFALAAFQSSSHDYLIGKELAQLQVVLDRQYDEYRSLQSSIEQLHILKHDLKHQIDGLRHEKDASKREGWIRGMEEELENYGFKGTTGNPVLDNIIEMKMQTARRWNVSFTCMADGSLLSFMHVRDLCTLFGNALDNALESVVQIEDPEKRVIQLNAARQKDMVCIVIRNFTENALNSRKDSIFPKTTKADTSLHGFGLKSIYYCVEKYNGTMSVGIEENWFRLAIMIPVAE